MHWLNEYSLFLVKLVSSVLVVVLGLVAIIAAASKDKGNSKNKKIKIAHLNHRLREQKQHLLETIDPKAAKTLTQTQKKQDKKKKKKSKDKQAMPRCFVIRFDGDMRASGVKQLSDLITGILGIATAEDLVAICLNSPGGLVNSYGLAASQLARIREQGIPLTVIVDQVAASGGYMMAAVANRILAAPFAIIGSIGVVAQIPNFNRLLKANNIDFEQLTAGKYKRTLTMLGENTDEAREKMQADLEDTHVLFQQFIKTYRPVVDCDQVATGEYWYGQRAIDLNLIDGIQTSDDFITEHCQTHAVYELALATKKSLLHKLTNGIKQWLFVPNQHSP